ncbi:polyprenyl synthetase family protein [Reichenbachiella agarivorans]|uniref:Polyprenyl synthetase family protein n=1 Tax=Reichenbachiella agarivorans TaxID=2979464 RepID=A0ABY6CN53_9BACT|nr:polyprenyl synthetase family protein [Reichenbachiella agarivorans]UXP31936.1 polyprenyl synthetase family protein [Reichenbachiella agarivorans]
MALKIKDIQAPVSLEMAEFEKRFRSSMKSNVMLLDKIMSYIVKRKGKQMRPMFVFLCAATVGKIEDSTYRGASLIELLHTATLVHDDVVDESTYRRGFFSVNALWKNKIAVLVGDFLLSRGMLLSIDNGDFDLLKIVSEAIREMSEGEILQMEKAKKLDITEEVYYEVIRQKTASLITACCKVGVASAGADPVTIQSFGEFGEKVGMAFQIKDDLFDYGTQEIGKPLGIDIREKKMTLPLIHALNQSSRSEKKHIINIIKKHNENTKKVNEVIKFVVDKGGLDYAQGVMNRYHTEAIDILRTFPDSEARQSLEQLVQFTIERSK